MRWIVLLLALWFAPVSFGNDNTEEPGTAVQVTERGGKCPGGKCPPKRPRPVR